VGNLLNGADIVAPGAVTGSVTVMAGQIGAGSDMTFGSPLGLLSIPGWTGPGVLTAPNAATIMSRGDFGADVNLTGADARGNSVNVFYCLGSLDGAELTLAGGAGTVMANSWNTGSLTAVQATTVMIRGNMGANVTMTGQNAAGISLNMLYAIGNVTGSVVDLAGAAGSIIANSWTTGSLNATQASTVMIRGDMGVNVTLTGQNTLGISLNMLYAMGNVTGSAVDLAGAAGVIYAGSWTGGSIQAQYVNSLVTIRGGFSADVNLTGVNAAGNSLTLLSAAGTVSSDSIALAGAAGTIIATQWAAGEFTAQNVLTFMSRGDLTGNVTLTGQNRLGTSVNVFYVLGEMVDGQLRTRGGIGSAIIGSMRDSGIYACVLDGVAGMPGAGATAGEYFAQPLEGMQTPAIRTLMISRAAGVFANSVVSAPSMGTVILRGVATDNEDAPFGLVTDTGITMLIRYRDGAAPSMARSLDASLIDTLPAEDDFQVVVL